MGCCFVVCFYLISFQAKFVWEICIRYFRVTLLYTNNVKNHINICCFFIIHYEVTSCLCFEGRRFEPHSLFQSPNFLFANFSHFPTRFSLICYLSTIVIKTKSTLIIMHFPIWEYISDLYCDCSCWLMLCISEMTNYSFKF